MRRISLGFTAALVGLNFFFMLHVLLAHDANVDLLSGTWRYFFASFLLIFFGGLFQSGVILGYLKHGWHHLWIMALAVVVIIMISESLMHQDDVLKIVLNSLVYLSILVIGILARRAENWEVLNKVFIVHTFLGFAFSFLFLLQGDVVTRVDLMSSVGYSIFISGITYYAVPFMVLTYFQQSKLGRLAAILGYISMFLIFVIWQSRIGIGTCILLPIMLFISVRVQKQISGARLVKFIIAVVLLPIVFIAVFGSIFSENQASNIKLAVAETVDRYISQGDFISTFQKDSRWKEAHLVLDQLSWDEWLLGRGIAATWSSPLFYDGEDRPMVHVAFVHFIFQGGILLLIIMLIPLFLAYKTFFKGGGRFDMGVTAFIFFQYIQWIFYGFPQVSMSWILFCFAIGRCLSRSHELISPSY